MFADASYSAYPTQGHLFLFASQSSHSGDIKANIIDWNSKTIRRVTRSTVTAECISVCNAVDQALYLSQLWYDMTGQSLGIRVFNDSRNLIHLCYNDKIPEEKRLMIEILYLRESIAKRDVLSINHLDTKLLLADALTKPQSKAFYSLIQFMESNRYRMSAMSEK